LVQEFLQDDAPICTIPFVDIFTFNTEGKITGFSEYFLQVVHREQELVGPYCKKLDAHPLLDRPSMTPLALEEIKVIVRLFFLNPLVFICQ
jgi:hypothetical protein